MKKIINKLRSKQSPGDGQKILINGIIEASRKYPNDMDLGRCVRYFLFEYVTIGVDFKFANGKCLILEKFLI